MWPITFIISNIRYANFYLLTNDFFHGFPITPKSCAKSTLIKRFSVGYFLVHYNLTMLFGHRLQLFNWNTLSVCVMKSKNATGNQQKLTLQIRLHLMNSESQPKLLPLFKPFTFTLRQCNCFVLYVGKGKRESNPKRWVVSFYLTRGKNGKKRFIFQLRDEPRKS